MISEADAREAARHLAVCRERLSKLDKEDVEFKHVARDMDNHAWRLACFAVDELARREAEQAERAKPITAELCKALGAVVTSPTFAFFRIPDAHNLNVYLDPDDSYVAYSDKSIPGVATMGQLLDMLAALKGGAA